jgi:ATP-dependent metalloprotease FtsH
MRTSPSLEVIMNLAAFETVSANFADIEPEHILMGVLKFSEFGDIPANALIGGRTVQETFQSEVRDLRRTLNDYGIDSTQLRRKSRAVMGDGGSPYRNGVIHRSMEAKRIFSSASQICIEERAGELNSIHLLKAVIANPTDRLVSLDPVLFKNKGRTVTRQYPPRDMDSQTSDERPLVRTPETLMNLSLAMKKLRERLSSAIYGQDHAIDAFVEGIFNSQILSGADKDRRKPKGLFVLAGPPGVGKTYLAETSAAALERPFKRFDMSAFSGHEESYSLIGIHKSYKEAHPGLLTGFVANNPDAILLFDEIEKAHLNTIHLFLQVMDIGRLEDKYTEKEVDFKETIVIFTTNAGKVLYDDPDNSGLAKIPMVWHRKTILNALETEIDQRTGKPFFPQAICSRMGTGYPIMFNPLSAHDLEAIVRAELEKTGGMMASGLSKKTEFRPLIPLCILLREGAWSDARTICSQAATFCKTEIFKLAGLYRPARLDAVFSKAEKIIFDVAPADRLPDDVRHILKSEKKPSILLITEDYLHEIWKERIPDMEWHYADNESDALSIIGTNPIDMVLLDLWIGHSFRTPSPPSLGKTVLQFDYLPEAASDIAAGQEILFKIRERFPVQPCYLLSFAKQQGIPVLDAELLGACNRSKGARGVISTHFLSTDTSSWEEACNDLSIELKQTAQRLFYEKKASELGAERKTLSFETVPLIEDDGKTIVFQLRNLRFVRAMAAGDVSEVLHDVERPNIRFLDVYGASAAKEELRYIVQWLKDPEYYNSLGLRPPKGILLHGEPGTGKTMLARALAGECKASFLVESATSFVTIWQGSGPQNIRDLFARARRYAPSILFIDEIDAVGKKRKGGGGADTATEQTLNALLVEMDGFKNSNQRPVILVAATNLAETLDDALRRRFDREVEVDKPDKAARMAYLTKRLTGSPHKQVSSMVIERMAGQSVNLTIADLERIVELAGRMATKAGNIITDAIVEEAFERTRMGEARPETDPETLLRIARHEAGHCLIGWLRGEKPVQITIVGRAKAGGFVERSVEENQMIFTRPQIEGLIRQTMGGRASEIVFYGAEHGLSSGASQDIRQASRYAEKMITEYGMDESIGPIHIGSGQMADRPLLLKVTQSIRKIVHAQLIQAIEDLKGNLDLLNHLIDKLMEKNRLTTSELEEILGTKQGRQ